MNDKRDQIIMVNVPFSEYWSYNNAGSFYPGLGVLLIATELKKAGFDVVVVDGAYHPNYQEMVQDLITEKTLMVGFSVMTSQLKFAYDLSKKLKTVNPKVKIVWGGAHTTLFHKEVAESPYVDYAIRNDFLQKVEKLVLFLQNEEEPHMPGVAFVDKNGKTQSYDNPELDDINKSSFIDYEFLDTEKYEKSYETEEIFPKGTNWKYYIIETGFGCVYKCSFCENTILKRKYRSRDAVTIVDRIQYLQNKYGANAFCLRDEDFFINKQRVRDFLDLVEERELRFKWHAQCSIIHFSDHYIDEPLAKRLADSGLVFLNMGGESGNNRVLKEIINKVYEKRHLDYAIDVLKKTSIKPWFSFMVGLPGEEENEMIDTYDTMINIQKHFPYYGAVRVFSFRLYPGSPMAEQVQKETNFSYPKTLEDWVNTSQEQGFLSIDKFHKDPIRFKIIFEYYQYLEIKNNLSLFSRTIQNIVLRPIFYSRFKFRFFSFPIEIWVIRVLKKIRNSLK